jgi:hypothetical protein
LELNNLFAVVIGYCGGIPAPWVGNGGSSCTNQGDWQPLPPGVYDTNSFTFAASTTSILGGSNIIVTIYTNSGFGTTAAIFSQNTFLGPLTNLAQMCTNWPLNQAAVGKGVWATVSITNNTAGNYSNCYFVNQVSHH